MSTHDRYDNGILKQLTRIANALEKIERKLPEQPILTANEMRYLVMDSLYYPCDQCGTDHFMWEEKIDHSDC